MDEKTTLSLVTEIGTFGSLDMKDPTATPVQDLYNKTNDPALKAYLEEQMNMNKK
jgi:hypothetical protein